MQGETEQELRLYQLKLIVIIMVIVFVALLSYTIYWSIDYNKKYNFFVKTDAVVVEQIDKDGITKDVLKYDVNGVEYRINADYHSKNEIGDTVVLYYDKHNPIGVIYSLDSNRIVLPIITGLFGVTCSALIVVYFLISKSLIKYKKKRRSKS